MADATTVTVLFCDLVGSTQLSSQFDPEEWREVVRAYQQSSADVLQRWGGTIAQYQGDGLLVYFGYPEAHEDAVRQAVHAGLEIVSAVAHLNQRLQQEYRITLAVRIGIHTGAAVFGTYGGEQLAVGETPAVAMGIQDHATPDTVVVSGTTVESLGDAFIIEDQGTHQLKGVLAPVQVVEVREARPGPGRQEASLANKTDEERPDEAERRQLTVMFCQLAGADQLPHDAVLHVVQDYQTTSAEVITRYDGHIAQYLDTGLLAYFGYPTAHEDDAQRAVRAGLAILDATQTLNSRIATEHDVEVALRLGIHTGLVVAGEIGAGSRTEQLAIGETPNVAARVQGIAQPGTVAISPTTAQLVSGYFEWEELGSLTLKGVPEPMLLRRVVQESGARSRLDVAGHTQAMVGREAEVRLLAERWAQSQAGQGQVVFVRGEAGIGKSRLVEALCEQVEDEGAALLRLRCSPYYQNSAFYPLIELFQDWLGFVRQDSPDAKLKKLEQTLAAYQFPQPETVPLFARFFSLPDSDAYPPLTGTPQQQRQRTQEALVAWMREEAARQPTLVVWEDLHWVDPSSLEVLSLLMEQVEQTRLCVLPTARPEFVPIWEEQSALTSVELQRLGAEQIEHMIFNVTAGRTLPAEVQEQIVAKTDGIPLFVEELTKTTLESGILRAVNGYYELTEPLTAGTIPLTLQDALMARLDRLGPAKGVAQLGAVIGREFRYDLLKAVCSEEGEGLEGALQQLVAAELVQQQEQGPQASYQFKHALIQDTAYESLLRRTRRHYHHQIAQVLEEQFPETKERQPELVAHHYTEAGQVGQAIPHWQIAGQRATQRSANVEAIRHLTTGLDILRTQPDTPARVQQELTLQLALGTPLISTKGQGKPEVESVYSRALELCNQLGDPPELLQVLFGLRALHLVRGELLRARELGEQILTLAQDMQDPARLLVAHQALAAVLFFLGEFALAQEHQEEVIVCYDTDKHNPHVIGTPYDPGVVALTYIARILWLTGYPDQALKRMQEALTLARKLSHPFSQVFAIGCAVLIHQYRREGKETQEQTEAGIRLANEQEFAFWGASATVYRGWALAEQGRGEEGLAQMEEGLAALQSQAAGGEMETPSVYAQLAEGYRQVGRIEDGLNVLVEALAVVDRTGACFYEADLYRLKGELTLPSGNEEEAEACFHRAFDIGRQQQAKSWELRAATSLARLWQQQGRQTEARDLLAPVYNWFTEGFDTKDLQEAKTLLDELG